MFGFDAVGGLILDCDGTLLDTLGAWDEAERELFAQAGNMSPEDEVEIHAAPIERAAVLLHERYGVGESAEGVLAHLDGFLVPFYGQESRPLPGAVEFVRAACERGVPCVVVSSSPRRYLEAGLARAGILGCFKELLSTDEVGCSKQEFGIYEEAVRVLGCPRQNVWAVDDAPYAVEVMHEFGLRTICVGPRNSDSADLNVTSLCELL